MNHYDIDRAGVERAAAGYLHVPAADPSVPAADQVSARRVLEDAIPPFPTFQQGADMRSRRPRASRTSSA